MTDAERLKVAEEIAAAVNQSFFLPDMYVHFASGCWYAQARKGASPWLKFGENLIEVVYLARQKLAAEREAAMTPSERDLRKTLTEIRNMAEGIATPTLQKTIAMVARKALEDS